MRCFRYVQTGANSRDALRSLDNYLWNRQRLLLNRHSPNNVPSWSLYLLICGARIVCQQGLIEPARRFSCDAYFGRKLRENRRDTLATWRSIKNWSRRGARCVLRASRAAARLIRRDAGNNPIIPPLSQSICAKIQSSSWRSTPPPGTMRYYFCSPVSVLVLRCIFSLFRLEGISFEGGVHQKAEGHRTTCFVTVRLINRKRKKLPN